MKKVLFLQTALILIALSANLPAEEAAQPLNPDHMQIRAGLENCRLIFEHEKAGRVVFIGGSITTATGWRNQAGELLERRFPETRFAFIDAGIGGTNSTLGAFRFERDVFAHGRVDLLFLEFAVNDSATLSPDNQPLRAMEGIIRHARRLNPRIDIIVQYFADEGKVADLRAGTLPGSIALHRQAAAHYGLPELDLASEITERLDAGAFTWEAFSRDSCHPTPFGHTIYAQCIDQLLDAAWATPPTPEAQPKAWPMPAPLDAQNYENGRFIPLAQARLVEGGALLSGWKAEKTCNYSGAIDVLALTKPGEILELSFEGRLLAYYGIAGMDAGRIAISVDGGAEKELELFDGYCARFQPASLSCTGPGACRREAHDSD